jgi:hypothetical protein
MLCPLEYFAENVVGIAQKKGVARGEEFGAGSSRCHLREFGFAQACQTVIDTQRCEECLGEVEEVTHTDCFGCANSERLDKNLFVVTSETVDE